MERVAFLITSNNTRVTCLLNPESLLIQRRAGVKQATINEMPVNNAQASDYPLIVTGGGVTALTMDLLFDTDLQHAQQSVSDVRALSEPLWQLCETQSEQSPVVRLVWGKSWNIPGVIANGAQRFDRFTNNGTPQRNWMRLRFIRISNDQAEQLNAKPRARTIQRSSSNQNNRSQYDDYISGQRLDIAAAKHLGDSNKWRDIAEYNNIDNPLTVAEQDILRLPPASFMNRSHK